MYIYIECQEARVFEDVNSQPKPHYKTVPVQLIVEKKKRNYIPCSYNLQNKIFL